MGRNPNALEKSKEQAGLIVDLVVGLPGVYAILQLDVSLWQQLLLSWGFMAVVMWVVYLCVHSWVKDLDTIAYLAHLLVMVIFSLLMTAIFIGIVKIVT